MPTRYARAADGTRIAYDVQGCGPALVLLHGGGSKRQEWQDPGYVERLTGRFTVITLDHRGHGESGMPVDAAAYSSDRTGDDVLAVADACDVDQFAVWGMSYGGNVGRFLAARSRRVRKLVLMSAHWGRGHSGEYRRIARWEARHWAPIAERERVGTLNPARLSSDDQELLTRCPAQVYLARLRGMLAWGVVKPADLLCPTLWMVGSEDQETMDNVARHRAKLASSPVRLQIVDGLDHGQVQEQINRVFDPMLAFTLG